MQRERKQRSENRIHFSPLVKYLMEHQLCHEVQFQ